MFSFGGGDIVFDRVKAKIESTDSYPEKDWKESISVFKDELQLFRFVLNSILCLFLISDNLSFSRFK